MNIKDLMPYIQLTILIISALAIIWIGAFIISTWDDKNKKE